MTLYQQLERKAEQTAQRVAAEWANELRRTNPVATGNMRNNTTTRVSKSGPRVRVEATIDTDYARYVAEGTRPHVIRPRRARALRFTTGGRVVYAAKVNHPGTRPIPWWQNQLRQLPNMLRRFWR